MAVKGLITEPDAKNFSSNWEYRRAAKQHAKFVAEAKKKAAPWQKPATYLLREAARRRDKDPSNNSYKNPIEYISDLWEDGFLTSKEVAPLLEEFQTLGKSGDKIQEFLTKECKYGHITGVVNCLSIGKEHSFPESISDPWSKEEESEYYQLYYYDPEQEIQKAEEARRQQEAKDQEAEDIERRQVDARIHRKLLPSLRTRTEDPAKALSVALETMDELRTDPFDFELQKLQAKAEQGAILPADESAELRVLETEPRQKSFVERERSNSRKEITR